jgi:hypothetical protein
VLTSKASTVAEAIVRGVCGIEIPKAEDGLSVRLGEKEGGELWEPGLVFGGSCSEFRGVVCASKRLCPSSCCPIVAVSGERI